MAGARRTGVRRKAAAPAEPEAPDNPQDGAPQAAEPAEEAEVVEAKGLAAVRALAAKQGPAAVETLSEIMTKGSSETARIAAANALLDRAYGKGRIGGEAAEPPPAETTVTVRFV